MSIAFRAMQFAHQAHHEQTRKYTGDPYTNHLAEVAGIVAAAGVQAPRAFMQNTLIEHLQIPIAVAWLHDVVEDTPVTEKMITQEFGGCVAAAVWFLTDTEKGNRATRAQLSRERLSSAPGWVQSIKVADMVSNTSSIATHDPKFARVYLEEKRLCLDVLTRADERLVDMARNQITKA